MDWDKQIHMNKVVSFVIQSKQVSEGGAISVSHHINCWFHVCTLYYVIDTKFA